MPPPCSLPHIGVCVDQGRLGSAGTLGLGWPGSGLGEAISPVPPDFLAESSRPQCDRRPRRPYASWVPSQAEGYLWVGMWSENRGCGLEQEAKKGCLTTGPLACPQRAPAPGPAVGAEGGRGLAKRPGLTTRLFGASLEEAFPTALSSIDLCLEAILKNELIVGKAWVEGRGGGE